MSQYLAIVKDWPVPTTRHEVRVFLGKMGYYRRFIFEYAKIARPLFEKLNKDGSKDKEKFTPSNELIESFEKLKSSLLNAPILAYPRFKSEEPFILDTDWSMDNGAIGACLSQKQDGKERVIAYAAKKLSKSQLNYAPTKGELYAVIFFIDHFKYYLALRPFRLRTDHRALVYLHSMQHPSGMIQRWLHTLSTYQFQVEHRAGTKHANADGLSRATHIPPNENEEELTDEKENIFQLNQVSRWNPTHLRVAQENDTDIQPVKEALEKGEKPDEKELKSFSAVTRLYLGMWESLSLDRYGGGASERLNSLPGGTPKI